MGKRTDWTAEELSSVVKTHHGNLTVAARALNHIHKHDIKEGKKSKVTRQNLQTWIDVDAELAAMGDNAELLKANRRLSLSNTRLRRAVKLTEEYSVGRDAILKDIAEAAKNCPAQPPAAFWPKSPKGKGLTIELLFSDLQIGKLMDGYDSDVALRRVNEWVVVVLDRIHQYTQLGYKIDKIVLALLGDIIESDKKHGHQSTRATDTGTAVQMQMATDLLFNMVIRRLAEVGVPIDVIAITGNHDWDGHGLMMFKPGREQLSWPMYHSLKSLCEVAGINANFFIPEGAFHIHEIYGTRVLYEHGVGVAAGYNQMKQHLAKRTDQHKKYITLFRMGDKHNICQYNNNRYVVNGAFFGDNRTGDEYSGIAGYDGEPAQIMFAHTKRDDDRRTTIFDSLAIQLGHIT